MKKLILVIMIFIVVFSFIFLTYYFGITGNFILENFEKDIDSFEGGFVGKVIDGDTVVINGESIRLLGIDADERGYECYNEAKKRLEELVLNKDVKLEKDVKDKDQYKRYLRYVLVNNTNINLQMVEEGLAIARFYEDRKYQKEILAAEKKARENKVGCKWKRI